MNVLAKVKILIEVKKNNEKIYIKSMLKMADFEK